jgi:DNA-directed RNA polymerase specialized sigma subunit
MYGVELELILQNSILTYEERLQLYDKSKGILPGLVRNFCSPRAIDPDLEVVAEIHLWKATSIYDPSTNLQFISYAWDYVIGGLKHELRDYSRLIRIPSWYQEKNPDYEIEIVPYEQELDLVESIIDSSDNSKLPLHLFSEAVPVKFHQGLKWFLRTVLNGETQVEISQSDNVEVNKVAHQIRRAKIYLYKSNKIREWARYQETPDEESEVTKKKKIKDIDPEKYIQKSAKKLLSKIEIKVLALAGVGRSDKEVAQIIGLSERTIHNLLEAISHKLGCNNKQTSFTVAFGNGE